MQKVVWDLGVYINAYLENWNLLEYLTGAQRRFDLFYENKADGNIKNELNKKKQKNILNDVILASSPDD